jgi:hypothetical protein
MPKKKIHEADVANLFDKVVCLGAATIREATLMSWMGWEKQTAGFWTELNEEFQKALGEDVEEGWQLLAWQNESQITLVCGDPEGVDLKDRWWQRVRVLAERPSPGRRKKAVVEE